MTLITAVTLGGRTKEDGLYSQRRYRVMGNTGKSRTCRVLLTNANKFARLELLPE